MNKHSPTNKLRTNRAPPKQLLVSRKDAAQMLGGVSTATIKRLEQAGVLHPRRLRRSLSAQVFYGIEEIIAVAQGAEADDAAA